MVGLDVTHRALLTAAHAERLRAAGRVGTMVAELREFYQRFHSEVYDFPGTPVHDAMAVAHVIDGALLTTQHRHVAIDCESSLCRGRTVVDLWKVTGQEPNAHVAVDVDADAFLELLVGRISALDLNLGDEQPGRWATVEVEQRGDRRPQRGERGQLRGAPRARRGHARLQDAAQLTAGVDVDVDERAVAESALERPVDPGGLDVGDRVERLARQGAGEERVGRGQVRRLGAPRPELLRHVRHRGLAQPAHERDGFAAGAGVEPAAVGAQRQPDLADGRGKLVQASARPVSAAWAATRSAKPAKSLA